MTTTPNKCTMIAIVKSRSFDYGPNDCDAAVSVPAGRDFAKFIEQRLVAAGATRIGAPVPGEEGWTFDIKLGHEGFRIFVHWAPIGNPPADRWVIQPDIRKPLFRSLFGRRTGKHEIEPMLCELRRVLDGASEIEEINWVSQEDFAAIY